MPSYIELDKQSTFPASSNSGKLIFGVNTSNQVTLTNFSGVTTDIGGGGTGLYIPKPIIYASKSAGNLNVIHEYNENISNLGNGSGLPGAIENSWNPEGLKLTYDTTDETFLNYNPKYFLFVYQGNKRQSQPTPQHPNLRVNNNKYGKYFVHPPSFSGAVNVSSYSNFGGSGMEFTSYAPSFSAFTSEWVVTPGKGHSTTLNDFNPLRFYYSNINDIGLKGQEFFPIRVDDCIGVLTNNTISITTVKKFNKNIIPKTTPITTYTKPRVNLHIKFAIVIDDPNNPGRYLIGPMSDTVRIFPKEGYFFDDIDLDDTFKYYYTWTWKLV